MIFGLIIGDWVCRSTDQLNSDVMVMHHFWRCSRNLFADIVVRATCSSYMWARRHRGAMAPKGAQKRALEEGAAEAAMQPTTPLFKPWYVQDPKEAKAGQQGKPVKMAKVQSQLRLAAPDTESQAPTPLSLSSPCTPLVSQV